MGGNGHRADMHAVLQSKILEAMVSGLSLRDVMELLCREVERIAPDVVASILAVDAEDRLRTLAGPSLPLRYRDAIDGLLAGPDVGSCGSAAWRGEPVIVTAIASDPLWADFKDLALGFGLAACWSSPIKAADGRVLGTFAFYYRTPRGLDAFHQRLVDVSVHLCALALVREENEARLHRLAFYDTLTGLQNRVLLCANTQRVLVDARRLAGEVRGIDLLARLAGDEFAVVLPHASAEQAAVVADRLLGVIAQPFVLGGMAVAPQASIGIAMHPDDGADAEALLHRADLAMMQAKTDGRGTARFFRAEMNARALERMALEVDLREALRNGGLSLHYQPQVGCSAPHALVGVEALLRWRHPRLRDVAPLRFIPLAEECGLIDALSQWVLGEACRQMAEWRGRGVAVPRVAVNLSALNFRNPRLPAQVACALRSHGLAPHELTLEMTEGVMLDCGADVLATIAAVHALGVQLSLDDFGTGYSSLSYLHRLPIDELKLDRSFVNDLGTSPAAQALVNTVLRIGESLSMTVVAEGVECEAERAFLAARGCPGAQGYWFARPLPPQALEAWLAARRDGCGAGVNVAGYAGIQATA